MTDWVLKALGAHNRVSRPLDEGQQILLSQSFSIRRLRSTLEAIRHNPQRAFGEYTLLRTLLEELGYPTRHLSNQQIIDKVEEVIFIFGGDWSD